MRDGFRFGSGCFTCVICGKRTRETYENSGTELCVQCCRESMMENSIVDGAIKSEEDVCPEDLEIYRIVKKRMEERKNE